MTHLRHLGLCDGTRHWFSFVIFTAVVVGVCCEGSACTIDMSPPGPPTLVHSYVAGEDGALVVAFVIRRPDRSAPLFVTAERVTPEGVVVDWGSTSQSSVQSNYGFERWVWHPRQTSGDVTDALMTVHLWTDVGASHVVVRVARVAQRGQMELKPSGMWRLVSSQKCIRWDEDSCNTPYCAEHAGAVTFQGVEFIAHGRAVVPEDTFWRLQLGLGADTRAVAASSWMPSHLPSRWSADESPSLTVSASVAEGAPLPKQICVRVETLDALDVETFSPWRCVVPEPIEPLVLVADD